MTRNRAQGERGLSTVAIVMAIVVTAGVGGAAYVATDGFGLSSDDSAAAEPTAESATPPTTPGTTPSAVPSETALSPMDRAFAEGKSVVCSYTYEAYEATTTLQSKSMYRIDQQTQGGLAHVIRTDATTYVWVEGMTEALEMTPQEYADQVDGQYPTFDPAEFDIDSLFDDGTCEASPPADESLFALPDDVAQPA